jgi:hypothetical protein
MVLCDPVAQRLSFENARYGHPNEFFAVLLKQQINRFGGKARPGPRSLFSFQDIERGNRFGLERQKHGARFPTMLVRRKTVSNLPIAVGDFPAQQRFIQQNASFLLEYPFLRDLYEKVFLRSLQPIDESVREPLLQLPETDPAVVAFEDKVLADLVVFYLGRIAADDFDELLTLSGNGRGFGAYKILRGMYERVVTAMYVAKHLSEARVFVESSAVTKRNYLTRAKAVPEMKDRVRDEVMQKVEENAAEVSVKRKRSVCSKCHQPVTQEAWTRVSMDVMAKEVDPFLGFHYHEFYVETTAQIHPNMFGVERRLVALEGGGYTYKEISEDEARCALYLGHNLMIRLLKMQNEYFNLGVDAELQERAKAFGKVWGAGAQEPPDESLRLRQKINFSTG